DDYIYRHIIPGKSDPDSPYGTSSYYSSKLIFKTPAGRMYVLSLPTEALSATPKPTDFRNLQALLTNAEKLRCDMYDNRLRPVALANKLVPLADHPSAKILRKFALEALGS